jgi:uncharacterized Zn finger protein (UPF0148 family)
MSSPPVVEERDQLQEQILRKRKISNTADLIRKGGSLLQEVCPKCGNLQIKYKERVYCVACDEMELVSYSGDIAKAPGLVGVAKQITREQQPEVQELRESGKQRFALGKAKQAELSEKDLLRNVIREKLVTVSRELESTQDLEKQLKLLDLLSKYLETLGKLDKGSVS